MLSRTFIHVSLLFLAIILAAVHTSSAGVTILIHGWHSSGDVPWWTGAMQSAIAGQHLGGEENFCTTGPLI